MILYFSVILFAMIVISVFNCLFGLNMLDCEWWFVLTLVVVGVLYEFAIDGFFAIIIKKMPEKWFSKHKKIFQISKSEIRFLNFFGVKKWKDLVWELGGMGGFSKKEIANPQNLEYIDKFLVETNKGVVIHWIGVFVGFSLVFVVPLKYALTICLPIAIVNSFLNFLPIMVLRYNTPKLLAVSKFLEKRENKTKIAKQPCNI